MKESEKFKKMPNLENKKFAKSRTNLKDDLNKEEIKLKEIDDIIKNDDGWVEIEISSDLNDLNISNN